MDAALESDEQVFSVAEINRAVRYSLEEDWASIWVEGELSDVTKAGSGHIYFTLCDEQEAAQIRGVMFRGDARRAKASFESGARLRLKGSLSLYEARGSFQFIARRAVAAGEGDLRAEFERVKKQVEAEGLTDPERKRALPRLPRVVGVVTAATGAAVRDVIRVASERGPCRIVVSSCLVQGKSAPASIIAALQRVQRLPELEVVIVGRGGGSAEDLAAFNDLELARAIAACRVPVVSAVGHEVDFSIADLVADLRASTPSNAAELVVPDESELRRGLQANHRALERSMASVVDRQRLRVERLTRRLGRPHTMVRSTRLRLDALLIRARQSLRAHLRAERAELSEIEARLRRHDVRRALATHRKRLAGLDARLRSEARPLFSSRRAELGRLAAQLGALSPLAILARGYAIALHDRSGKALTRASEALPGDRFTLKLHEGELRARVDSGEHPEQQELF